MKKTFLFLAACMLLGAPYANALSVQHVEPLCWWTNMTCPLTLMVHGDHLATTQAEVTGDGLVIKAVRTADSPNYLFIDLDVRAAGTYTFTLRDGRKRTRFTYQILDRPVTNCIRESFSGKDMIYLLMPDRFRDGDPSNNTIPGMKEASVKGNIDSRMGGDLQGMIDELPHIADLGATFIWPTPLTWSNDSAYSYHGYACADYYHIDPRFGTNDMYKLFVQKAHELGIKVIMDVVTNHSGIEHWWAKDLPYHDWWHQWPTYTTTNNAFTTVYDPNASKQDLKLNFEGWFDHHMPDMNLDNPDLLQYFKQCYIWWIEWAGIDGLRVDTYPYNEPQPMAEWCQAIRDEYPWINIVGETWTRPAANVAYWQSGTKNLDGFDSHLPAVMDFPLEEAIRQALENDGNYWGGGMCKVYDALASDQLYGDVNNLLVFVGNHDTERFADIVLNNDPRRVYLGHLLIATMRGIPQTFAGDEYMQRSADRSKGHSGLRQPLPTEAELTPAQKDLYQQMRTLWQWRKTEPVLWNGKTMHFLSRDNTYAYVRYTDDEAILVFINASNESRTIPIGNYQEILSRYPSQAIAPLEGNRPVDLTQPIQVAPLSSLVIKKMHFLTK